MGIEQWEHMDTGGEPQWHVYTYVTNLHILHMYPITKYKKKQKENNPIKKWAKDMNTFQKETFM